MRTLKFIVYDETVKPDPLCNFTGLFPGKNDNVQAEFEFSSAWVKADKVIAFWSVSGTEYEPQLLDEHNTCKIPVEALKRPVFKIQVIGRIKGMPMITNRLSVYQRGDSV